MIAMVTGKLCFGQAPITRSKLDLMDAVEIVLDFHCTIECTEDYELEKLYRHLRPNALAHTYKNFTVLTK